jgi:hypothetical protein
LDVAQALSVGQLGKRHAKILIEAREALDLVLAAIARHATTKRRQRQMLRDLREHQFAQVHRNPLRVSSSQDRKLTRNSSNRDQKKSWVIYFRSTNYCIPIVQRPDSSDLY